MMNKAQCMVFSVLVMIVCLHTGFSQDATITHNGYWLKFYNSTTVTYDVAKEECALDNATLVIIPDNETQIVITNQLRIWEDGALAESDNNSLSVGYWAGGTLESNWTYWKWQDGSALPCPDNGFLTGCNLTGFSNWLTHEPNDFGKAQNNGLAIVPVDTFTNNGTKYNSTLGKWYDDIWNRTRKYICQKEFCAGNPCLNGGSCNATESNYTCTCDTNWIGQNCNFRDPCLVDTCSYNGQCIPNPENGEFTCKCETYYYDNTCSLTICESEVENPCENNGTCFYNGSNYNCTCKGDYTGYNCTIEPCFNDTCINNGTCYIEDYTAYCNCTAGYTGTSCEVLIKPEGIEIWIPIVAGVGGFLLLVLVIGLIYYTYKKRRSPPNRKIERQNARNQYTERPQPAVPSINDQPVYEHELSDRPPMRSPRDFADETKIESRALLSCLISQTSKFEQQFKNLPDIRGGRIEIEENSLKYVNDAVQDKPYEKCCFTREYSGRGASRNPGVNGFVLSAYPNIETADKFWEMIRDESCSMIISFGQMDDIKDECFPNLNNTKKYGPAILKVVSEAKFPSFTIRTMELQFDDVYHSATTYEVQHLQWARNELMMNAMSNPQFHQFFQQIQLLSQKPAAGMRASIFAVDDLTEASVFIAFYWLVCQLIETNCVNVCSVVTDMRKRCQGMIKSLEYYKFLYQAITEYHVLKDENCSSAHFTEYMKNLTRHVNAVERTDGFDALFEHLDTLHIARQQAKTHNDPMYMDFRMGRNNFKYRGFELQNIGHCGQVIATKSPSDPKDAEKLWYCILSHKIQTIISISHHRDASMFPFRPERIGVRGKYGDVSVQIVDEEVLSNTINLRTLRACKGNYEMEVQQYDYTGWPVSVAPTVLREPLDIVLDLLHQERANLPLLVHCDNGLNRTGPFLCTMELLHGVMTTETINVPRCVNNVRLLMPGSSRAIANVKQFRYLFDVIENYITNRQ